MSNPPLSPPKPPPTYTLAPATPTDIPSLITCFDTAFAVDPVIPYLQKNCDPEEKRKRAVKRWEGFFEGAELTGARFWKVVDGKGNLVAFGKWNYPVLLTAAQKVEKEALENRMEPVPKHLPGANGELADDFMGQLVEGRKRHCDPERDFFMNLLSVHPSHHRQGLGSLLLARGLADADAAGANTYIEASPMGLPLYLRHGWEEVSEMSVDLGRYGIGEGLHVRKNLVRRPGGAGRGVAAGEVEAGGEGGGDIRIV